MKKKVLKVLIGETYNKSTKTSSPVYASYWEQKDGTYTRTEKIFVNEVDIKEKEPEESPPEVVKI